MNTQEIPDQSGRIALVTGANTGIGYEVARALARRGAEVILGCRDEGKAESALGRLRSELPGARLCALRLDLADLGQVRHAAGQILQRWSRLDLLVNNAGVMWVPYGRTKDGSELHLGINHLGHFALTGLLLERLLASPGSRVVTVSSLAHRSGEMDFDDPDFVSGYRPQAAYARSKLANLWFAYELQRRLARAGAPTVSLAAHPGGSQTEILRHASRPFLLLNWLVGWAVTHPPEEAAKAPLRAATDPQLRGGEYISPRRGGELWGPPEILPSSPMSRDEGAAARLWALSEERTAVRYPL